MKKGLLLGAGFSYDLGMPLVGDLTKVFLGIFEEKATRNFAKKIAEHNPYGDERPINERAIIEGINLLLKCKQEGNKNYEDILSQIERIRGKSQSDKDSYSYLSGHLYSFIYDILRFYQIESYSLFYEHNYPFYSKLQNLLSDEVETWVFSLNHDLYTECIALDSKLPVSYGDEADKVKSLFRSNKQKIEFTVQDHDKITSKESFIIGKRGINLVKLHGGLNEFLYNDRRTILNQSLNKESSSALIDEFKLIQDTEHRDNFRGIGKTIFTKDAFGEIDVIERSMLTGGTKFSKTNKKKPGEEKLQLFDDVLKGLDELTIIGYGFNDFHINFRLSNAMLLNKKLKIRIVDPLYRDNKTIELLQQFNYDLRIRGAICTAPDWLNYIKEQKWYSSEITKIRNQLNNTLRSIINKKVESIFK